ncbi:phage tail protein [Yersinia enterocolitica]
MANEILPFGLGAESNVMTQAEYEALAARSGGFSSGVAKSEQLNKVWRQSSFVASVLADFIAKQSGNNVLDDGNVAVLLANLELAIKKYAGSNLPDASLTQKGVVQLSSSITSISEVLAATPKAVKAANDAALQKSANLSDLANAQTALTNLGLTGIGIGLPSMTGIDNFDFQTFVFTSGANYIASSTNWLNVPTEISYPAGLAISIKVDYVTGTQIGLEIKPSTVSSANFRVWYLRMGGNPGSRTFTAREVRTSANKIPASGIDVATNAEVATGTVDKLVNVPGLMSLFSKRSFVAATSSGAGDYIRIPDVPGGLIIQWVRGAASTSESVISPPLAFPIAFPTACVFVSAATQGNGTTGADQMIQVTSFTTTNVSLVSQGFGGTPSYGAVYPLILSIGY